MACLAWCRVAASSKEDQWVLAWLPVLLSALAVSQLLAEPLHQLEPFLTEACCRQEAYHLRVLLLMGAPQAEAVLVLTARQAAQAWTALWCPMDFREAALRRPVLREPCLKEWRAVCRPRGAVLWVALWVARSCLGACLQAWVL